MSEHEEPSLNSSDVAKFLKWRSKQQTPEATLNQQYDLYLFRKKYGVYTGSNFHCPWCWTGRLYYNTEEDFYVCRGCELRFKLECLDPDTLDKLVIKKKADKAQKRIDRKGQKGVRPGHEDIPEDVLAHLRSIQEE